MFLKNTHIFTTESPFEKAFFDQWQLDDRFFIPTKACKEVEIKIQAENLVIVTGHSGSGKSAIIQHIALSYRKQGWVVKPLIYVRDFQDIYSSEEPLVNKTFFVLNDPFGKEAFDEPLYRSWSKIEDALKSCLKTVKLLMSCRKYVLTDDRVKGLFSDTPYIVDVSNDHCKLTEDEKRRILNSHTFNLNLSEKECAEIVKVDTYFPLLCKLYATKKTYQNEKVRFFKKPVKVFQEEIRDFKVRDKEKYCALVLLVFFNNDLDVDLLQETSCEKKYTRALKLCGLNKYTPRSTIGENLKSLKGFFVKKVGNNYQFYHDFVMEVTTLVFGTDYPTETLEYADIGFLRRRVRLKDGCDPDKSFYIYVRDTNTDQLGERLFNELFGERILDVVLNPCLENEKIISVFKKLLKLHPEKFNMLLETKSLYIKKQDIIVSENFSLSKLAFLGLKNEISPLFALIVFGHTKISIYCLEYLKQMQTDLTDSYLFSAVCCSGSIDLFHTFFKNDVQNLLNEKWSFLNPIHTLSAFHQHEMMVEVIEFDVDINLKTDVDDDGDGWTPLILAAGNNTKEHSSEMWRNTTVELLLRKGADINLCNNSGVSPLYIASLNGYDKTVELLLKYGPDINLAEDYGESPLFAASKYGHDKIVELLIINGADVNLCSDLEGSPLSIATQNLSIATQNGYARIVRLLIENNADVNLCSID